MRRAPHGVLYAGMYALGNVHRAAWQEWFSNLSELYLKQYYSSLELSFVVNDQNFTDSNLIAAQTCGYPFITHWVDSHEPLAVPIFGVQGCNLAGTTANRNGEYSSWFIANADATEQSLAQFQGGHLAINNETSNSGMNVLRYAISQLTPPASFFSERMISGGHRQSMQLLAEKRVDIAAIDVISYALIGDLAPELIKQLKIVGQSVSTMGLPFICRKKSGIDRSKLCAAMNTAVKQMDPKSRKLLYLKGFEAVARADYEKIRQLEQHAILAGYPALR